MTEKQAAKVLQLELKELNNQSVKYPDFKGMGRRAMADFIWMNDTKLRNSAESAGVDFLKELRETRNIIEMEAVAKSIFLRYQEEMTRLVTTNPASTISISSEVE